MNDDLVSFLPLFARAAATTIGICSLSLAIGTLGGAVVALLRMSKFVIAKAAALAFTELFRSIPVLIVLFFSYFGLPLMFDSSISPLTAVVLALAVNVSAMMSEVIRAGIESVGHGQWEAAKSAGMTYIQSMRYVIGPQAMRVTLPPTIGVFIISIKESSLASTIGYLELTRTGLLIREQTGGSVIPLLLLGAVYFVINYLISLSGRRLERRYSMGVPLQIAGGLS